MSQSLDFKQYQIEYKQVDILGEGSFGTVYKIYNINTKKNYALKKIQCASMDEVSKAVQELSIASKITSKYCTKIHYHYMREKQYQQQQQVIMVKELGIIMELAEKSLRAEINYRSHYRKPFSLEDLECLLKQMIEALAQLQEENIAHKDLKPENILIFGNNQYKLTDFGLSMLADRQLGDNILGVCGTPVYMSPLVLKKYMQQDQLDKQFRQQMQKQQHYNQNQKTKYEQQQIQEYQKILSKISEDIEYFRSDVFSLGLTILEAANLKSVQYFNDVKKDGPGEIARALDTIKQKYKDTNFINILRDMLEFEEYKRPDFTELHQQLIKLDSKNINNLQFSQQSIEEELKNSDPKLIRMKSENCSSQKSAISEEWNDNNNNLMQVPLPQLKKSQTTTDKVQQYQQNQYQDQQQQFQFECQQDQQQQLIIQTNSQIIGGDLPNDKTIQINNNNNPFLNQNNNQVNLARNFFETINHTQSLIDKFDTLETNSNQVYQNQFNNLVNNQIQLNSKVNTQQRKKFVNIEFIQYQFYCNSCKVHHDIKVCSQCFSKNSQEQGCFQFECHCNKCNMQWSECECLCKICKSELGEIQECLYSEKQNINKSAICLFCHSLYNDQYKQNLNNQQNKFTVQLSEQLQGNPLYCVTEFCSVMVGAAHNGCLYFFDKEKGNIFFDNTLKNVHTKNILGLINIRDQFLVSYAADQKIIVHELNQQNLKKIREIAMHAIPKYVIFQKDNDLMIVGFLDGTVNIYSQILNSNEDFFLKETKNYQDLKDMRGLYLKSKNKLLGIGKNGKCILWQVSNLKILNEKHLNEEIKFTAFSPQSQCLVVFNQKMQSKVFFNPLSQKEQEIQSKMDYHDDLQMKFPLGFYKDLLIIWCNNNKILIQELSLKNQLSQNSRVISLEEDYNNSKSIFNQQIQNINKYINKQNLKKNWNNLQEFEQFKGIFSMMVDENDSFYFGTMCGHLLQLKINFSQQQQEFLQI